MVDADQWTAPMAVLPVPIQLPLSGSRIPVRWAH